MILALSLHYRFAFEFLYYSFESLMLYNLCYGQLITGENVSMSICVCIINKPLQNINISKRVKINKKKSHSRKSNNWLLVILNTIFIISRFILYVYTIDRCITSFAIYYSFAYINMPYLYRVFF